MDKQCDCGVGDTIDTVHELTCSLFDDIPLECTWLHRCKPNCEHWPHPRNEFELAYRSSNAGGYRKVTANSYGQAVLQLFEELKGFDHYPRHAHIEADGHITFRGKTLGQIV